MTAPVALPPYEPSSASRDGRVPIPVTQDGAVADRVRAVDCSEADRLRGLAAVDELAGRTAAQLDSCGFFDAGEVAEGLLPAPARSALAALRRGAADAVVIRGLAPDDAPGQTPTRRNERVAQPPRGHAWISIAARRLGHEYAYALEKGGAIVQDIHPTREGAETQSNASWRVDLQLHTENAFHAIRPDFVLLYCVRAPAEPPATRLALVDDVVARLTDAETAVLRQERFTVDVVESFRCEGATEMSLPLRILGGTPRRTTVRWHESLRPRDDAAMAASQAFARAATASAREIRLHPGDLLAFANDRCLHGRDRFAAGIDGADRWLLRCYALRDVTRLAAYVSQSQPRVVRYDLSSEGAE